jgi:hypothetical protein
MTQTLTARIGPREAAGLTWTEHARHAGFTVTVRATTIELHKYFCPLDLNQYNATETAARILLTVIPTTRGARLDSTQRLTAIETGNVRITLSHVSKPFSRGIARHAQTRT